MAPTNCLMANFDEQLLYNFIDKLTYKKDIWFQYSYNNNTYNVIRSKKDASDITADDYLSFEEIKKFLKRNNIAFEQDFYHVKFDTSYGISLRPSSGGGGPVIKASDKTEHEVSIKSPYYNTLEYENAYAERMNGLSVSYNKEFNNTINSALDDKAEIFKMCSNILGINVNEKEYECVSFKMTKTEEFSKYKRLWKAFGEQIFSYRDLFNPSDVFLIKNGVTDIPESREEYNEAFLNGDIIGISLKKHINKSKIVLISNCSDLDNCVYFTPHTFKLSGMYQGSKAPIDSKIIKKNKYNMPTLRVNLEYSDFINKSLNENKSKMNAYLDFRPFSRNSGYSIELKVMNETGEYEASWGKGWALFKEAFGESKAMSEAKTLEEYYNEACSYIASLCDSQELLNVICAFCAHYPMVGNIEHSWVKDDFLNTYNKELCYYFKVY